MSKIRRKSIPMDGATFDPNSIPAHRWYTYRGKEAKNCLKIAAITGFKDEFVVLDTDTGETMRAKGANLRDAGIDTSKPTQLAQI